MTHIYKKYISTSIHLSLSFSLSLYIYIWIHTRTHTSTHPHPHTHIYIYIYSYIYIVYWGSMLSKHVWSKTTDCFLFKIFKWRRSSLVIFLMSRSRLWRTYPILAQVLLTISLVILRGCVRLFIAESFIYIFWSVFFFK